MKISASQQELARGIDTVIDVVPTRSPLPVLSNVLLEAKHDSLTLSATDLDMSVATRVQAQVEEPGKTAVPARKFAEIIRELPDTPISIEVTDNRVMIRCQTLLPEEGAGEEGSSQEGVYCLTGVPPEDFPDLPAYGADAQGDKEGVAVKPDAQELKDMIGKTIFAVSSDETRPFLRGVLWQIDGGRMTMVATDGFRLAKVVKTLTTEGQPSGTGQAIVPPKALNNLVKLISAGGELTEVILRENHVVFDLGATVLFTRVIEGPYPNYEDVIPKHNEKRFEVTRDVLIPAVKRVSILSSSQTHQLRMVWEGESLKLSAVSQEIGAEARESIASPHTDQRFEVGYNANYLLEILRKMDPGSVVFELDTPMTSGVIRPGQQPEGQDYLCLIMPLRLNGPGQ